MKFLSSLMQIVSGSAWALSATAWDSGGGVPPLVRVRIYIVPILAAPWCHASPLGILDVRG